MIVFLCLGLSSTVQAQSRRVSGKTITSQYNVGLKLFETGKYLEAHNVFAKILQQYPDHKPSLVYYAKSLYRMDRIPDSYQYFARLDLNSLDIVTSYEYALAFFWMRQYSGAFVGFTRVPKDHPLADLANYYGGISALKIRRYADAEAMMERAVVLPTKLAKSRKLYMKHISEMKLIQEKSALAIDRQKERERLAQSGKHTPPPKQKIKEGETIEPPAPPIPPPTAIKPGPYMHAGFTEVERSAQLGVSYKNQKQDFHGFAQKESKIRLTNFIFEGAPIHPLPIGDINSPNRSAVGAQITLLAEEQKVQGDGERRNIQTDNDHDLQRILSSDPEDEITKHGTATAEPWVEFALPEDFWLAFSGKISFRYPDFEREKRTGSRGASFLVGVKKPTYSLSARYRYTELVDSDNQPTQTENNGTALLTLPFADYYYLDLKLFHKLFTYQDKSINGPTSSTSLSGDLYRELPFGFTIGLVGAAQYDSEYLLHDLPTYGEVNANGQVYTGRVYLLLEPFTWISGKISWEVQKSNWDVTPGAAQQVYEQNQVDILETFEAKVSLNLLY